MLWTAGFRLTTHSYCINKTQYDNGNINYIMFCSAIHDWKTLFFRNQIVHDKCTVNGEPSVRYDNDQFYYNIYYYKTMLLSTRYTFILFILMWDNNVFFVFISHSQKFWHPSVIFFSYDDFESNRVILKIKNDLRRRGIFITLITLYSIVYNKKIYTNTCVQYVFQPRRKY